MSCGAAAAATRRVQGHAGRQPWTSQIIRPSSDAVLLGRSVRAVVRLGSGVRSFQAWLGGRTTTGAFRPAATGSTRVASLRYGSTPGLQFGRNTLYVRTSNGKGRRWFTQRSFVLARPVGGLFNAATATPGCGTGADVRVALVRPGLAVNVRVDGGRPRAIRGGRKRSINLYANSGLHPGANVLTVQALDAGRGVYQRRVLRVTMPSTIPVAAAGISRRAKTGHAIAVQRRRLGEDRPAAAPGLPVGDRHPPARLEAPGSRALIARTRSCGRIGRGATSSA